MSRGQAKRKASEGKAAMAYMRRLHGDPATAPLADLAEQADADYDAADLALGPEGEQTTDPIEKKKITTGDKRNEKT